MSAVISLVGAKGGSGKTATALALGSELMARGFAVAIVDCDPQASATISLPQRVVDDSEDAEDVAIEPVLRPTEAEPVIVELEELREATGSLHLYRSGRGLVTESRERVRQHIERARAGVDLVIVDTLPALSPITFAAMDASDRVVIPLEPSADSLHALPGVVATAEHVAPSHDTVRLLLTKVDRRERIGLDVAGHLDEAYPGRRYDTLIPRDVRAAEASWYLRPVVLYAPDCRAAAAYRQLADEVIEDIGLGSGKEVGHGAS